MDAGTLGQYSGYIAMIIAMGAMVIGICNHKKCRSRCFGREATVSLDIGPSTPTEKTEKTEKTETATGKPVAS